MSLPRNEYTDLLFQSILALKSVDECYAYFDDLCTIKEVRDMGQRLAVAFQLRQGDSYQKIIETTGISSATICRVNRCLSYGSGGYNTVIDRMQEGKP